MKTCKMIRPCTNSEAISLAAIIYGINICESSFPIYELFKIQNDYNLWNDFNHYNNYLNVQEQSSKAPSEFYNDVEDFTNFYTPWDIDSPFGINYLRSPSNYDIRKKWCLMFSHLYTQGQLDFFALKEGFSIEKIRDLSVFTADETLASGFSAVKNHVLPSSVEVKNTESEEYSEEGNIIDVSSEVVSAEENPPPQPPPSSMTTTISHRVNVSNPGTQGKIACFSSTDALKFAFKRETIFLGWHIDAKNKESPISLDSLEEVLDESNGDAESCVISFGTILNFSRKNLQTTTKSNDDSENTSEGVSPEISKDDIEDGSSRMVAYSIRDLCNILITSRAYIICDPDGKTKYFTKRMVKKLKEIENYISSPEKMNFATPFQKETAQLLKSAIRLVDMRDIELSQHAQEILKMSSPSNNGGGDEKVRDQTVRSFEQLLNLGMYMRGWKVSQSTEKSPHPFPLSSLDTIVEPERQAEVDLNVTAAIAEYEKSIDEITNSEVRRLVRSAPLLRLISRGGSGGTTGLLPHFGATVNVEQGFTIEDRVGIVKDGVEGSLFSCMRMSSNLLVASAYYYLITSLGHDPGFDISLMDEIF
jgi:hypothetical protein